MIEVLNNDFTDSLFILGVDIDWEYPGLVIISLQSPKEKKTLPTSDYCC